MRRAAGVVFLSTILIGNAAAQRCLGGHSYRASAFRIGAGIDLDKFAETYGVDVRYSTAGVFGIVDAAIKTWGGDTFNDEGQILGAAVGIAFPRDGEAQLSLCPMVSLTTNSGPKRYSEQTFSGSLSLGYLLSPSSGWEVVPTAMLTVGTTNATLSTLASYKSFCCGRRTFGTISFGVGLGLGRTITILPTVAFPLGAAGETTYKARLVIGLGDEPDL